jgi:hypothetical protein
LPHVLLEIDDLTFQLLFELLSTPFLAFAEVEGYLLATAKQLPMGEHESLGYLFESQCYGFSSGEHAM